MSRHPASNDKLISEPVQCAQEREDSVRYHLVYMMTICMLMESQGSEGEISSLAKSIYICMLMELQGSEGGKSVFTPIICICMLMESQGSEGWFLN